MYPYKLNKITLFGLLLCALQLCAQSNPKNRLLDPEIRNGILENGMEYFIKKNVKPEGRASFYLVQKVGAILEEDHQNGLAHMLEHLAFNGSRNFPEKGMQDFLERNGAEFGKSMNAYTGIDETVYNISNVPVNESILDSCVLILHDWSGSLTLSPKEIEAERLVIQEEWRTRNNADFRMDKALADIKYNHSKYAERDVIGDMDIILNFKHESLIEFYNRWYRPDLQAVIIVGDFDLDAMEERVKRTLSRLTSPENIPERPTFPMNDNTELNYGVATDPEARYISFEYAMKHPQIAEEEKNEDYILLKMKRSLIQQLLNRRFNEELQKPDATYTQAQAGYYPFVGNKDIFITAGVLKENTVKEGIKDVITVIEEAKNAGFTQEELNLAKINLLKAYEYRNSIEENITHDDHSKGLTSMFLSNEPYIETGRMYNLAKNLTDAITIKEINKCIPAWYNHKNAWFTIKGPRKSGLKYPSKEEVLQIIDQVKKKSYTINNRIKEKTVLLTKEPEKGAIVKEKAFKGFEGAKIYKLSNGASVWMFPTSNAKNDIHYSAISKGGISLLKEDQIPAAKHLVPVILQSGLAGHNQSQLIDLLAGKALQIKPELEYYTEGYGGGCSVDGLETLLQLQYLYFTEPRLTEEALAVYKEKAATRLNNQGSNPRVAFNDTVSRVMSNYSERRPLNTLKLLNEKIELEELEKIYKQRFINISDFTFIFVGSVNDSLIKPLIEKYISSIEGIAQKENWTDHKVAPPEKDVKKHFQFPMSVQKNTNAVIHYSENYDYNLRNNLNMKMLQTILDRRLFNRLREEVGGTYGVHVDVHSTVIPRPNAGLSMFFDCDPDKGELLHKIIADEVQALQMSGAGEEEYKNAQELLRQERLQNMKKNTYVLNALKNYALSGENLLVEEDYQLALNKISFREFNQFIKYFLNNTKTYEVIMKPQL